MKKKGFTLIELLAVIVILAIIALIATPMVLNTIDDARKGASSSSAYTYVNGVETKLASYMLKNGGTNYDTGKHAVSELQTDLEVKVKGDTPSEGNVCIGSKGIVTKASLKINGYVVNYDGETATTTDLSEIEDITCDTTSDEVAYKCKRATTLHTEECTQTSNYCYAAGYTASGTKGTTTITYGNLGTSGTLTSGDAFTCDVNGDGNFDEATERFYYVSELSSNTEYAVLVYYNNTTAGVADNTSASLIAYDSSNKNYQGPVTGITNLPTTTEWSNVSLSNTSRAIVTQTGTTSTKGGELPTAFSYTKIVDGETVPLAARLLTAQEVNSACGITVGSFTIGELDGCNYLMENTKYSSSTLGTYGYWLETPHASNSGSVWSVSGSLRSVGSNNASYTSSRGVRPAIEILKSEISY